MLEPSPPPFAAIILAAGKGTRMRSALHKVLHPVGGRPMLLHLMATLGQLAPARTVVVAGDRAHQIEAAIADTGAAIAIQEPQLGTGHAVAQGRSALSGFDGDVLVLFGDAPLVSAGTMRALLGALHGPGSPALAVLAFRTDAPGAYGRVIAGPGGHVERIVEARDATPAELAVTLVNAGMMAVRGGALFGLLDRLSNSNAAGEYYLTDIVGLATGDGAQVAVVEAPAGELLGVNTRVELAAVEAAFQAQRRHALMLAGVHLVAPDTVFLSHDTDIGADSVVEPFVVFGPGVRVGEGVSILGHSHIEGAVIEPGCTVGPFARLRPGTVLRAGARVGNFVETKKAELGAGAKANHLSYVGDASVGAGANIGAGTITCNYDGYFKYRTVIGSGAFIGSNSALVAPVTIGDGAIVGAGSTITADVPADALALARGAQVVKPGRAARFRATMQARKDRKGQS